MAEIKVGDKVRVASRAKTTMGGFVDPDIFDKVGVVGRTDYEGNYCVRSEEYLGSQFIAPKFLTLIDEEEETVEEPASDAVNHPSHYTSDPSGVECIQITRHRNFNVGNAIKYLWRAGLKSDASQDDSAKHIEDLKKAVFYIQDEIERLS